MSPRWKQPVLVISAVAVIVAACLWIYFHQIKKEKFNVGMHQRIGEVLAEQTAALVGKKGKVVTIAIPTQQWPELETEVKSFRRKLRTLGDYEVRDHELDPKDQPKYGVGSGLSGRRYVRTVKKNESADVFVSFIGAPELKEDEIKELNALKKKPRLVALTRSTDSLPALFQSQLIQIAVVSRFQFPSPGPENPKTPEEWFTKRYQVITPASLKGLPEPSGG